MTRGGGDFESTVYIPHLRLYEAINPYNEDSLKRFTVAPLPEVRVQSVFMYT